MPAPKAPGDQVAGRGSGKQGLWDLAKGALIAIRSIVLAGIRDSPPFLQAVLVLIAVFVIFGLVLTVVFVVGGHARYALTTFLVSALAIPPIASLAIGLVWHFLSPRPDTPGGTAGVVAWSRLVPDLPIPDNALRELYEQLDTLRSFAATKVQEFESESPVRAMHIRVNVFLPDIQLASTGEICCLHIPERLHVNMQNKAERDIRFRPNEGLTGKVFCTQTAQGARAAAPGSGDIQWVPVPVDETTAGTQDASFRLDEEQRGQIERRLKWIIAFPLVSQSENGGTEAMGVLNVDCLDHDIGDDTMKRLFASLAAKVLAIAIRLAQQKRRRVGILVQ